MQEAALATLTGLAPEAVSVVDTRGNLLNRARKPAPADDPEPSEEAIEYRQRLEHDVDDAQDGLGVAGDRARDDPTTGPEYRPPEVSPKSGAGLSTPPSGVGSSR